jgi:hypothetical protein
MCTRAPAVSTLLRALAETPTSSPPTGLGQNLTDFFCFVFIFANLDHRRHGPLVDVFVTLAQRKEGLVYLRGCLEGRSLTQGSALIWTLRAEPLPHLGAKPLAKGPRFFLHLEGQTFTRSYDPTAMEVSICRTLHPSLFRQCQLLLTNRWLFPPSYLPSFSSHCPYLRVLSPLLASRPLERKERRWGILNLNRVPTGISLFQLSYRLRFTGEEL